MKPEGAHATPGDWSLFPGVYGYCGDQPKGKQNWLYTIWSWEDRIKIVSPISLICGEENRVKVEKYMNRWYKDICSQRRLRLCAGKIHATFEGGPPGAVGYSDDIRMESLWWSMMSGSTGWAMEAEWWLVSTCPEPIATVWFPIRQSEFSNVKIPTLEEV